MHYISTSTATDTTLRVPADLLVAVKRTCAATDTTVSQVIRASIRAFVDSTGAILTDCPAHPTPRRTAQLNFRANASLLNAFYATCAQRGTSGVAAIEALLHKFVRDYQDSLTRLPCRDFEPTATATPTPRAYESEMLATMFRAQGLPETEIAELVQEFMESAHA